MITAQELHKNHVIKYEGDVYKIIDADFHVGGGKTGGMVHVKMRNLNTGHLKESRLAAHDKIEDLDTQKQDVEFLFGTKDECTFMNQSNFEQVTLSKAQLGNILYYLKEGMKLQMEFLDGNPISINFPPNAEAVVTTTAAGLKGDTTDSTYKSATLDNGMDILVPQFIKEGDLVKIEVETGKYLERVKK